MESELYFERRRSARVTVSSKTLTVLATNHARVLEINSTGVMLACTPESGPLPVGARAVLRTALPPAPFSCEIQVRRREPITGDAFARGFRVAATFVNMNAASRAALEQFLERAAT